jgi:hypothetical protein
MFRYQSSAGTQTNAPAVWPVQSHICASSNKATLLMILHPHCPCSRASVRELNQLMAKCEGLIEAHVIFVKPHGFAEGWEKSDLWKAAASIPGVSIHCDDEGNEARLFQAATSGQTLVYDKSGKLFFSGGVTAGRGHSGDNPGAKAISTLLSNTRTDASQTPVYGCSLFESAATINQKKTCCTK